MGIKKVLLILVAALLMGCMGDPHSMVVKSTAYVGTSEEGSFHITVAYRDFIGEQGITFYYPELPEWAVVGNKIEFAGVADD